MKIIDMGTFDYVTQLEPVRPGSRTEHVVARTRCLYCDWCSDWSGYAVEPLAAAMKHVAHRHGIRTKEDAMPLPG